MKLARPGHHRAAISLVPMIDVLMIMLIFFIVISSYLELKMVPLAEPSDATITTTPRQVPPAAPILVRIAADGVTRINGQELDGAALRALLAQRLAVNPATPVIVLPSGQARTQSLVSLLDLATGAGVARIRVLRLEARP